LYACLAARDVNFGDGPELTAAAIADGVAHPPGYPLWIVLGHLASLVPAGPLPYRVNLTAALYHALAVGLTFSTALLVGRNVLAALAAALALGIGSPLFVTWSLQAEVFSLNDLFAAAIVLLCVAWLLEPRRWRLVIPVCALFGLGLANHQSLILLAPLPAWAAWCGRRAIPRERATLLALGAALLAALLGFALPYVHTVVASQRFGGWRFGSARNWGELVDLIDRRVYGAFNLVPRGPDQGSTFPQHVSALLAGGGWPFALSGAGAAGLLIARRFRLAAAAALIAAIPLAGFSALANVNVGDGTLRAIFQRFGLLSLTALAPFAAGLAPGIEAAGGRRAANAALAAGLAAVAIAASARLPALSLANERGARTVFTDVSRALPPHAILLTAGDSVDQSVPYFQRVERLRPDVTVVTYGLLDLRAYVEELRKTIRVPDAVLSGLPPQFRRDLIVAANPERPFYTVGEKGIHEPGPRYHPAVYGVVSRMAGNREPARPAERYREEAALESAPGYGEIDADTPRSNGFGADVREFYAGGFFSAGHDAEELGDARLALYWYERAGSYSPDALIKRSIDRIAAGH
jgi:hypothetical protein